jgi:transketolase
MAASPTAASHKDMANAIRALSMDAVQKANSGHPGMPMGMADVATVLFTKFLKYDPAHPEWSDRDRFVLSAGHGSMLLYSLLYLTGYPGMTIKEIENFRQLGSKTAGHPEHGHAAGIETTTGPLGQGLGNAVGMALAERMLNARHGDGICNHYTYVIAGDGCLMEGISHEAISLAGHLRLSKLIVLFDDNSISIDGATSLAVSDDQGARFAASGWETAKCDGHDPVAVAAAIEAAKTNDRPTMIACKTIIGFGAPKKQGTSGVHGSPLGPDEIAAARKQLGWDAPPFVVPAPILSAWRAAGARGAAAFATWEKGSHKLDKHALARLHDPIDTEVSEAITKAADTIKAKFIAEKPKIATRVSSQQVLEALIPAAPALIAGSADLTGSVGTKTSHYKAVNTGKFDGNYIHYGVRELGMAAAMNGMALHGGLVPFGGTFLVFTDYARPAIRLSSLMGQRVIYVMTHDSIGLGEDGPTHQAVEHLAALRAIPNLHILRPADPVEVAECWEIAIHARSTPSILALSRQNVPTLRSGEAGNNMSAKGAYVLRSVDGKRDVTLIATGTEVQIAVEAADALAKDGIKAAVVSMPASDIFDKQPAAYRAEVLGTAPRIGIEAAIGFGWERWLGTDGVFIGMPGYGASGPYEKLYEHFGITSAKVVAAAKRLAAGT